MVARTDAVSALCGRPWTSSNIIQSVMFVLTDLDLFVLATAGGTRRSARRPRAGATANLTHHLSLQMLREPFKQKALVTPRLLACLVCLLQDELRGAVQGGQGTFARTAKVELGFNAKFQRSLVTRKKRRRTRTRTKRRTMTRTGQGNKGCTGSRHRRRRRRRQRRQRRHCRREASPHARHFCCGAVCPC